MAGRIRASDIEEVKSRVNIADVVGEYVALKTASVGSLKGLCPFHDEKSPSFNVRPAQGFYHCFGCGEGGDVYKFVQQIESLGFYEAVERLAARIGFELTYEDGVAQANTGARSRILEANRLAAEFYAAQLMSDEANTGRDFLKGRGFDKAAAEQFGIGYAPKGWSSLTDHLKAAGFTIDELVSAGLAAASEKGGYDKFRGRLIWPIRDASNAVIGFGARKLYEDDNGPKYLNTSDTVVYHKSQVLYGIDLAKKDITKKQQVVVVEGYTDVMACHLAGITTAVATCGTAFGDDHIRILNRMLGDAKDKPAEVIFTFDPDAAGQKAAMRAFADAHKFNAQTFVAVGPNGLDPCDLRSEKGDAAVVAMIDNRRPMFEFAIQNTIKPFDMLSLESRVAAAKAASVVVAQIGDPALRSAYTRELATLTTLEAGEVARMVDAAIKNVRTENVAKMRVSATEPTSAASEASNSPAADPNQIIAAVDLNDPNNRVERQVLEVLVQVPTGYTKQHLLRILSAGMTNKTHQVVLEYIASGLNAGKTVSELFASASAELTPIMRELAVQPLPADNVDALNKYAAGVIKRALEIALTREKNELLAQLRRTDSTQDPQNFELIQRALVDIETERRNLQGN